MHKRTVVQGSKRWLVWKEKIRGQTRRGPPIMRNQRMRQLREKSQPRRNSTPNTRPSPAHPQANSHKEPNNVITIIPNTQPTNLNNNQIHPSLIIPLKQVNGEMDACNENPNQDTNTTAEEDEFILKTTIPEEEMEVTEDPDPKPPDLHSIELGIMLEAMG
ncbi:hypothetical protein PIB30_009795 [Stylosanthes scabra]|uniref:Uncharacterized protein n=1 Tax=Stylosanthes scabra TaxID=79078 RepID=A0ABU6Y2F9_9FABA|nr:hypothetical protein [Stylosanthes scabra]